MLYLLLLVSLTIVSGQENPLQPLFSWKQIDWNFPNDTMRQRYVSSGDFSPENCLPSGIKVWNDKLFVTVPRWKKGVPATLNYINLSEAENEESPRLTPYPDWETNDIHADDAIVNILTPRIDACDRLWAVDNGIDDMFDDPRDVQPPKLIAIDLKTNEIVLRYTFKDSDLTPDTVFVDSAVDVDPNNCDDAYVYNSDAYGYGLVVYSLTKNDSWRIQHNYFFPDPLSGYYTMSGMQIQWMDGIFGLALSPPLPDGSKTLYFHPMSSTMEFSVSTNLIKNQEALAEKNSYQQFRIVGNKGEKTQGPAMMYDPKTAIIYFTQVNKNAMACWDTNVKLEPDTFRIVAQDDKTLVYPKDMALDLETRKLYLLVNDHPTFRYSEFDWSRINFYLHSASLDDLAKTCKGTPNQYRDAMDDILSFSFGI